MVMGKQSSHDTDDLDEALRLYKQELKEQGDPQ